MFATRSARASYKDGVAAVEVAVCLPVLLVIIFGFIGCGFYVQLQTNSKLIGHMAASELFQADIVDGSTTTAIRSKYEQLAADLGLAGFSLQITGDASGVFTVRSSVPFRQNHSYLPISFSSDEINTETSVVARIN